MLLTFSELSRCAVSLAEIIMTVTIIVFAAGILEYRCYLNYLGKIIRPLARLGRLPDLAAQAFAASFASGSAAGMMLAEGHKQGAISRRVMICGALCNSVPPVWVFQCYLMLPVIGSIGWAGVWYFMISAAVLAASLLIFLLAARRGLRDAATGEIVLPPPSAAAWPEAVRQSWLRCKLLLFRILLLTVPCFLWTAYFLHHGVFEFALPAWCQSWLSPAALGVIAARTGGLLAASGAAAELLRQQAINMPQLLLALLIGNLLNGITRLLRRGMPVSLGIYPGYDGAVIAVAATGVRILLTLIAIVAVWSWQ